MNKQKAPLEKKCNKQQIDAFDFSFHSNYFLMKSNKNILHIFLQLTKVSFFTLLGMGFHMLGIINKR